MLVAREKVAVVVMVVLDEFDCFVWNASHMLCYGGNKEGKKCFQKMKVFGIMYVLMGLFGVRAFLLSNIISWTEYNCSCMFYICTNATHVVLIYSSLLLSVWSYLMFQF